MSTAFERGEARALAPLFSDRVDVSVLGNASVYSGAQASFVLARFFESYPPRGFHFEHRMAPGEGSVFASGRYRHAEGYAQVMVRLSRRGQGWELRELRIEPGGQE